MRRTLTPAVLVAFFGLTLTHSFETSALAQAPAGKGQASAAKGKTSTPTGPDTSRMARYVPAEGSLIYFECDGLEAHADAWKKTAAYKILNETPTGAMLEQVVAQYIDLQRAAKTPTGVSFPGLPIGMPVPNSGFSKLTGAETVAMFKQLINGGFVFAARAAVEANDTTAPHAIWVIRGGAKPAVKLIFGKFLGGSVSGPNAKISVVNKGKRRVYLVDDPDAPSAKSWGWSVETNGDLLVGLGTAAAIDLTIAHLDRNGADASTHPKVMSLAQPEGTFQPILWGLMDLDAVQKIAARFPNSGAAVFAQKAGNVKQIDIRWGLDGPAVMSIARLVAPSPRSGALSFLDQPTFTTQTLPPLPADVSDFTVTSLELKSVYDRVLAIVRGSNPMAADQFDEFAKKLKDKQRTSLRDDVFGRLGPKIAFYSVPAKKGILSRLTLQVPDATMLAEVSDPAAFGKSLDELMMLANREMKSRIVALQGPSATPPADEKEKAPPAKRGRPGSAVNKKSSASTTPAVPEFKMTSASPKTFVLNLPPAYAALTNLQLTISVGKKHVAISSSAAAARKALALESKTEGRLKPDGDLAEALDKLPKDLFFLDVDDPRDRLPNALALLTANIQKRLNEAAAGPAALAAAANGSAPMPGAGAGPPGRARRPGMQAGGGRSLVAAAPPGGGGGGDGDADGRSRSGQIGRPGSGTGATAPDGSAANGPTIRVDPSLIPQAAAIKPLLFTGTLAASVDSQGVTFTSRSALPYLISSTVMSFEGSFLSSLLQGSAAAQLKAAAMAPPPASNKPPGRGAPAGGAGGGVSADPS